LTIIITASNRLYSLCALDRRLTKVDRDFSLHSNNANKGICLRLRDGIFTIGFTGIAHLNGLPIDDWLASIIMGKKWSKKTPFFELASFSFGRSGCPEYLNPILKRIHKALSYKAVNNAQLRHHSLEISVSGLRTKNSILFPYLLIIRKPKQSTDISYELVDRAISRDIGSFKIYISGGYDRKYPDIVEFLENAFSSATDLRSTNTVNSLIGKLHMAVRLFSQREKGIGADIMRIAHLPLAPHYSKIDFVPENDEDFRSRFLYGEEAKHPIHYNPWIISAGTRFSPQGIIGKGTIVHAGGHKFELAAVGPPSANGTCFATLPLDRK
jgi:hypothetical protein